MNGYSKINVIKSRSIDSFPQTPNSISKTTPQPQHQQREQEKKEEELEENDNSKRSEVVFGNEWVLKRNSSVSSGYGLQSVKRVFSLRRSSSVSSERYCRIHDQSSPMDDDETRSKNKSQRRGKILKACKRLFGL